MKNWSGKLLGWLSLAAIFAFGALVPHTAYAASAPGITTQPQSQSVLAGTNATFSVVATGQPPLFYQWSLNGTNLANSAHISGATNTALVISNLVASDAGNYQVVVSNSHGTATSSNATLTVLLPPTIINQPAAQTVLLNSNATFTAQASGTAPLSYHWQKNGVNLLNGGAVTGATTATLNLSGVQTNDAGSYQIVVTNNYGAVTSSMASLTVAIPASILNEPVSRSVGLSSNASFTVNASGSSLLSYQWRRSGTNLTEGGRFSGTITATLNISNAQTNDAGSYQVQVSNSYGSVTSSVAVLTVLLPPIIISQPTNQSVLLSSNAAISATIIGDAPLNCRWYFQGAPLTDNGHVSGSTTTNLAITNVQTNDAGSYQLFVTNSYGSATSTAVTLTMLIPATITSQPTNRNVLSGTNVTFTVTASGTAPLNYLWYFNGTTVPVGGPFSGITTATLSISGVLTNHSGNYQVVVSNNYGSVTSSVATLTVYTPVQIIEQPVSQAVLQGSNAIFTVTATGTGPLSYQWQRAGTNLVNSAHISGATNPTLVISNLAASDAGNYQVLVSNSQGSVTSTNASLTVLFPPAITSQPANQITYFKGSAAFSVSANGTAPLNYQWYFGGAPLSDNAQIAGSATATLNIANVLPANIGNYQVIVTNNYGSVTSTSAALSATNRVLYVNINNPNPVPPYTDWNTAATNIQDAVDAAGFGDRILVTNGIYSVGSRVTSTTTNCVAVTNAILISSISGATQTIIDGGGAKRCVYLAGGARLTGFTLTNGSSPEDGGGAYAGVLSNCLIVANSAVNGGGVANGALFNCVIASNLTKAYGYAGGAYASTLNGCQLTGNGSWSGGGGAGNCTLVSCLLSNNYTFQTYSSGGGADGSTLSNCVVIGNAAWDHGGGANNCTIMQSLIVSNTAVWGGGVNGGTLTLCVLQGNSVKNIYSGGGAGAFGSTLYNCLLTGNSSSRYGGGAYQSTLIHCTVAGNATTYAGGGTYTCTLTNCIIYYNSASFYDENDSGGSLNWCCTTPLLDTSGSNIASAPLFADLANGNYRLSPGSPCIDAGTNGTIAALIDLDGNSRIVNGTVDMGAYEFQNTPFIVAQPTNQTVPFGQPSLTFNGAAVGPGTLTYQWMFNGTNLAGATSPTLTLNFVQYDRAGNYSVLVTSSFGSTLSSNAMLTIIAPTPPAFTTQPVSQTVLAGTNFTLTTAASGAPSPAYRWYFNGTALGDDSHYGGTASAILQVSNVLTNDMGNYFVMATNVGGAATSAVATLTVATAPTISQQPVNQNVLWGANTLFTVAASGIAPISYQWTFNGSPIVSATNTFLMLTNLQPSDAGLYAAQVSYSSYPIGAITSLNAVLAVILPPAGVPFITRFSPAIATAGATVTISGTNFSTTAGSNAVFFGTVRASVLSASGTNLVVTVPSGATYSPILVTVNGLTAYSTRLFTPTFIGNSGGISTANFGPRQNLVTGANPGHTVIADFDGDGKPDLIVPNGGSHSVSLFRNVASIGTLTNSSFTARIDLPTATGTSSPYDIAVADVDGDGKPDLIVSEFGNNQVDVYRNISTPGSLTTNSFAPRITFATGVQPQGVVVIDLDGDGRPDILTANTTDGTVSILHNTGAAGGLTTNSFAPKFDLYAGPGCDRVAVGDLNGDGKPDVITANNGNGTVSIFQNVTDVPGILTSSSFAIKIDLAVPSGSIQVSLLDIDGDGKLDIGVTAYLAQLFSVIQNLGIGGSLTANSFGTRLDYPLNGRGHMISAGDLDGDSKPDVVVDSELSSLISIFRNVSAPGTLVSGSLAAKVELAGGYNTWGSSICDLDGDGRPEIVFANTYDGNLSFFQNLSTFGGPLQILTQPTNQSVLGNTTASFNAYVTGQSPACQWYLNGTAVTNDGRILGANTASLILSNTLTTDGGDYYLVVTNNFGAVTSLVATLTIQIVPVYLTQQPTNQNILVGKNVSFSVLSGGNPPFSYFWYANGNLLTNGGRISGTTTATLVISGAQTNDTTALQVVVTNNFGSVTSSIVNLAVFYPVGITNIPTSQAVLLGGSTSFSIGTTGSVSGYQWLLNGSPLADNARITGSATPTLTISGIQPGDAGAYVALATNPVSSAISRPATLTPLNTLAASVRYVALTSTNPQSPYLNWATAATNIQDAIDASVGGDLIWVTNGVYQSGGRAVFGAVSNRVVLDKPVTVQSINGPAVTTLLGSPRATYLRCAYLTDGAALSGFTLTNGGTYYLQSTNPLPLTGAGVFCETSGAIVSNCVIVGNLTAFTSFGGGASGGTLIGCLLTNNSASQGGGSYSNILINCTLSKNVGSSQGANNNIGSGGGASYCTLSNCLVIGNSAGAGGGTFACTVVSCLVSNNTAASGGGVAFGLTSYSLIASNRSSNFGGGAYSNKLINCILKKNVATGTGGGSYGCVLISCTVVSNAAGSAAGGGTTGGISGGSASNSISYYNVAGKDINFSPTMPMNFCCTPNVATNGSGNITNVPLFVNVAGADYHLQNNSSCINAGKNSYVTISTDFDGNPRIVGGTVDIGAYEFQSPASVLSYAWAQQYGLPTDGSADSADSDDDGLNNWQEWKSGTVPTNSASVLQLASPSFTNNPVGIKVTWQSASGVTYYLQRGTNLALQPPFFSIVSNLIGQPVTTSYTDTTATNGGPYFYRVGVQ